MRICSVQVQGENFANCKIFIGFISQLRIIALASPVYRWFLTVIRKSFFKAEILKSLCDSMSILWVCLFFRHLKAPKKMTAHQPPPSSQPTNPSLNAKGDEEPGKGWNKFVLEQKTGH